MYFKNYNHYFFTAPLFQCSPFLSYPLIMKNWKLERNDTQITRQTTTQVVFVQFAQLMKEMNTPLHFYYTIHSCIQNNLFPTPLISYISLRMPLIINLSVNNFDVLLYSLDLGFFHIYWILACFVAFLFVCLFSLFLHVLFCFAFLEEIVYKSKFGNCMFFTTLQKQTYLFSFCSFWQRTRKVKVISPFLQFSQHKLFYIYTQIFI